MVTEDTDECLLTPSPCHCAGAPAKLTALALPAWGVALAEMGGSDMGSDESPLSFVFALVVDPPASLGKYSVAADCEAGTVVFGEVSDPGVWTACRVLIVFSCWRSTVSGRDSPSKRILNQIRRAV